MNEYIILEKGLLKNQVKKIHDRENEILTKAKQVEKEIFNLRNEKIELITNLYREQLINDVEEDKKKFKEATEIQLEKDLELLNKEKEKKSNGITKLMINVEEQIRAYKALLIDLKEKVDELEISYLAAKEYLTKDRIKSIEEYNIKANQSIEDKTFEFKNQIMKKQLQI